MSNNEVTVVSGDEFLEHLNMELLGKKVYIAVGSNVQCGAVRHFAVKPVTLVGPSPSNYKLVTLAFEGSGLAEYKAGRMGDVPVEVTF